MCWKPGKLATAAVKGQPVAEHKFDLSHCCRNCCRDVGEKKLLHCGSCRAVSYCSKSCQMRDWGEHKTICLEIQELSERYEGYNNNESEDSDVYTTNITPKEHTKIAKLIGQKCMMFCKLDGVELQVLLDAGAQVSIMSEKDLKRRFGDTKVHGIEELLDPGVDLELSTANGTQLPYLGWVKMTIELKGPSEGSNKIIVPMLITHAALDLPIIGYNVLEQLVNVVGTENQENYLITQSAASFPKTNEEDLEALVNTVLTDGDIYLSTVKTSKRDTLIKAGKVEKISCRVKTGFFAKDTPVVFENDLMCPLPPGHQISESLLNLKRGNCSKIDLVCQNISAHDIELKGRTNLGSIHLVRSVTPVAVKLKGESDDIKMQSRPEAKDSAIVHDGTNYNESFVPNVPLSEDLTDEEEERVLKMLYEERDAFCKDDDDVGCVKDFEMKINLSDSTPVQKNYVGVARPLL